MKRAIKKHLEIVEILRDERAKNKEDEAMGKFWDLGDLLEKLGENNEKKINKKYIEVEGIFMQLLEEMKEEYFNYGLKMAKVINLEELQEVGE